MRRLTYALIVLALLAGCSSMSVQTDFSPDVDFSGFETFKYEDSGNTLAGSAPLAHQRIVAAIRQEMNASGLTEVDENADVSVTYYGSTNEQLQFQTTYMARGFSRRAWRGGVSVGTSSTRAVTVEQGTLMIDVWATEGDQLVWRGVVSDTLSGNPDRNTNKINQGIARAFEKFPPE
jgi:hypothetical protein